MIPFLERSLEHRGRKSTRRRRRYDYYLVKTRSSSELISGACGSLFFRRGLGRLSVDLFHGVVLDFLHFEVTIGRVTGDGQQHRGGQRRADRHWRGFISKTARAQRRARELRRELVVLELERLQLHVSEDHAAMIFAIGQGYFRLLCAGIRLSNWRWEQHGAVLLSSAQPDRLALECLIDVLEVRIVGTVDQLDLLDVPSFTARCLGEAPR